jgi:hypothetical protein
LKHKSTAEGLLMGERYVPRDSNVAAEDFDGEFVVLDLESGKYFSLAGGAAIVWRGLSVGHSVDTLTAALPAGDARREQAAGVVSELVASGLIRPDGEATGGDAQTPQLLAASTAAFDIQSFDDLADLLVADPIHDVDAEAGWPHLPPKDA